jgi:hypothetical protein
MAVRTAYPAILASRLTELARGVGLQANRRYATRDKARMFRIPSGG